MGRMAFDSESFQKYLDNYDLKGRGAGSQKDPAKRRLSAEDVGYLFDRGIDRGGSKSDVARLVLGYADDERGKTSMGGGTERALNRLRGYVKDDKDEKDFREEDEPGGPPRDPTIPGPVTFAERKEQATYPPFAGSYFDFVGGDPSNPADYYEGDPSRGGLGRFVNAMAPENVDAPVPGDVSSFMRSVQTGEYLGDVVSELSGKDEGMARKTYVTESDQVAERARDGLNLLKGTFRNL